MADEDSLLRLVAMDNLHSGDIHTYFGFIASFPNPFIFIALLGYIEGVEGVMKLEQTERRLKDH